VARNPYSPPGAPVADRSAKPPPKWGRAALLYLPIFAGLLALLLETRALYVHQLSLSSVSVALALSAVLIYQPLRHLAALNEQPPAWYWDAFYYATVALFIGAIYIRSGWLMIATGLPTVLMNGALGLGALVIEWRRAVRVYVTGRRFVFAPREPR
jgi:hypothetical protein